MSAASDARARPPEVSPSDYAPLTEHPIKATLWLLQISHWT